MTGAYVFPMVELDPVRAWHPNPGVVDPDEVVCPVYDTLSEADFVEFARRPANASRFVPRPRGVAVPDFLQHATRALTEALGAHAYVRDDRPAYYVYGIHYVPPDDILEALEPGDRRPEYLLLGVVGSLDLGKLEHGQVALHERTFPDRVSERVALTEATGMTFAPILTGYHLPDHRLNDRLEKMLGVDRSRLSFESTVPPLVEATLAGTTHRLWRVDDPAIVAAIRAEILPLRLLILDGHHRFTASAQRQHAGRPTAPLVMLVDGGDRALRLLPWHRVLPETVAPFEPLLSAANQEFEQVIEVGADLRASTVIEHLHRMRQERVRGFLMAGNHRLVEVRGPASDDAGGDFDLLHSFLDDALQIDPEVLRFVRSPRHALDRAEHGDSDSARGTAFLLPGLSARGVEQRAFDRGEVMAQKSTMFLPKVVEGMLFAPADPGA